MAWSAVVEEGRLLLLESLNGEAARGLLKEMGSIVPEI